MPRYDGPRVLLILYIEDEGGNGYDRNGAVSRGLTLSQRWKCPTAPSCLLALGTKGQPLLNATTASRAAALCTSPPPPLAGLLLRNFPDIVRARESVGLTELSHWRCPLALPPDSSQGEGRLAVGSALALAVGEQGHGSDEEHASDHIERRPLCTRREVGADCRGLQFR